MAEAGGLESINIVKENVVGDKAQVTVNLTYADGTVITNIDDLTKDYGRWKMVFFLFQQ